MANIKQHIQNHLKNKQVKKQRDSLKDVELKKGKFSVKSGNREFLLTGIDGFDELIEKGIPRGVSVLVAGGAGSGKTIFCLQVL